MMTPALELRGVRRAFTQGPTVLEVLKGIDLTIQPGEIVALVGHSGAGKSTLLQICGLLEPPTAGDVLMGGVVCQALDDTHRTKLRRQYAGFVYQFHYLLPEFSALENVILPQYIAGVSPKDARQRATDLLTRLGLSHRLDHRPQKLSGGEQQRVAIARALANTPKILLADEPTGNLDDETADKVFAEMMALVRDTGLAALIATHNTDLAAKMDRTLHLKGGVLMNAPFNTPLQNNNG